MNGRDRAVVVLLAAEKSVRNLGADALQSGNYSTAFLLAETAERLQGLAEGVLPTAGAGEEDSGPARTSSPKRGKKTNQYPKFVRSGADLLKIGWSKKSCCEYKHRAARASVFLLVDALTARGAEGSPVSGKDLLEIEDPTTTSVIPTYQVYATLGWLTEAGLIEPLGRRGSLIPIDLRFRAEAAWKDLPQETP